MYYYYYIVYNSVKCISYSYNQVDYFSFYLLWSPTQHFELIVYITLGWYFFIISILSFMIYMPCVIDRSRCAINGSVVV